MIVPPSPKVISKRPKEPLHTVEPSIVANEIQVWDSTVTSSRQVRPERTGFRDEQISLHHRTWGFNCPGCDIDLLFIEYHVGMPVALVEYKDRHAWQPSLEHPTIRALRVLADNSSLPFIIAFYDSRTWAFRIIPVNEFAQQHFTLPHEVLSERSYVERLYRLRNLTVEREVFAKLSNSTHYNEIG